MLGIFNIKSKIENRKLNAIAYAIVAAALYGFSSPFSKILLNEIPPAFMAALLYLGAGIGMMIVNFIKSFTKSESSEASITKKELPFVIGMIILDIAAPILLMLGLTMNTASNASLLNNFEIVATSLIALFIFKEAVGRRMWIAIGFISLSSFVLSMEDLSSFSLSLGSIFILLACISWGFENNCTRMLSLKDPIQIVVIKGLGSGVGALLIAMVTKEYGFNLMYILLTLLLGFFAYGMSVFLYIMAQRDLGAARTSTFYATAPFIGVFLSWIILKEPITFQFLVALSIMVIGVYFAVSEEHEHIHTHLEISHNHKHSHSDDHHNHFHAFNIEGEHVHEHSHEIITHKHSHLQDLHHRHSH